MPAFVSGGRIVIYDGARFIKLATPGFAVDPAFIPGSGEIAYAARTGAHSYILATEIMTGRTRQLTEGPGDQSEPAISADGKYLAFTSNASGPKAVWVKNLSTAAQAPLTGGRCNSFAAAWQPDGSRIVFASDCGRGIGLPALYKAPLPDTLTALR